MPALKFCPELENQREWPEFGFWWGGLLGYPALFVPRCNRHSVWCKDLHFWVLCRCAQCTQCPNHCWCLLQVVQHLYNCELWKSYMYVFWFPFVSLWGHNMTKEAFRKWCLFSRIRVDQLKHIITDFYVLVSRCCVICFVYGGTLLCLLFVVLQVRGSEISIPLWFNKE